MGCIKMRSINRKQFDNGLVLLTERIPSKRKTTLLVGVKVGSVNETERINGGSHFNEHLLFKSNKHRTAKQIAEDFEQGGTSVNAFTHETATVFYAKTLSSESLKVIPIIYESATNFNYDTEEFERERGVILTEINLNNEQPMGYSFEFFQSFLFQGTPLEKRICGTTEAMGNVTKEELENFKREYYEPGNMVVVAVGNFEMEKLEQKIAETFGALQRGKALGSRLVIPVENKHREKFEERANIDQVYLNLGYRVPGTTHEDAYKLKMLNGILSMGMSSRIFQKLREEKGIGYAVGTSYESLGDIGLFTAYVAGFDPKKFDEAREIIFKEFKDLKQNLVSDEEFKRTKNLLVSRLYDILGEIDYRAMIILDQEFTRTPYDFRKAESYIKKVTKEQVREVANEYLSDDYTLTALKPANEKNN